MNRDIEKKIDAVLITLQAIETRIKADTKTNPLFPSYCNRCEKTTHHISHIINTSLPAYFHAAATTAFGAFSEPLKTCLACGLTTFRCEYKEKDESHLHKDKS